MAGRMLLRIVMVISAVIACVLLGACSSSRATAPNRTAPAHATTGRSPTSASPADTASAAARTPSPATAAPHPPVGFQPESVTFVSAHVGWALGTIACPSGACLAIRHTVDGGQSWTGVAAPPTQFSGRPLPGMLPTGSGVDRLVCGDANDCWAYGPELWSTHDGGATWHRDTVAGVPDPRVVAVAVAGGLAEAAIDGVPNPPDAGIFVGVASSPLNADAWTLTPVRIGVGAGPVASTQLVTVGAAGWLLQVDRVVGGGVLLQHGKWSDWDTTQLLDSGGPCQLAPASATTLFAACDANGWIGAVGIWSRFGHARLYLAVSDDGGASFKPWTQPPPSGTFGPVAAAGTGAVFVAGENGTVFGTFDSGQTWQPVLNVAGADAVVQQLAFFGDGLAAAIVRSGDVSTGGPISTLYLTHDGGHTWAPAGFGA